MVVPKTLPSPIRTMASIDDDTSIHIDDDIVSVPVPGQYVLVTGGAGYIGSHTVLELLSRGHDVVVVDDLSNSQEESLHRIAHLTGRAPVFRQVSILDADGLRSVFEEFPVWAVIHFAGYKSVNESIAKPLSYYRNNVWGSCILLEVMQEFGVRKIVFSSSATVYASGDTAVKGRITEAAPIGPINPYGRSKYFVEEVIRDVCTSDPTFSAALLRYFNPIGAHPSGIIGEDPRDIPNNLLPYVTQVLVGRREHLTIHGSDYPTKDGTGVRDFIHVVDLALGHLAALEQLRTEATPQCHTYNMGTGQGYSVLDVVREMEVASSTPVKRVMGPRRPGDAAEVVGDPSRANKELGWKARRDIKIMCASAFKWQKQNPEGYTPSTTASFSFPSPLSRTDSTATLNADASPLLLTPGSSPKLSTPPLLRRGLAAKSALSVSTLAPAAENGGLGKEEMRSTLSPSGSDSDDSFDSAETVENSTERLFGRTGEGVVDAAAEKLAALAL
ncbi:hypothetical protein HDU96_010649 [Phlyctochytrium bullatum]|nr:hypothetical protein HDU96_010649 [Phlyctochytrium bullatum]